MSRRLGTIPTSCTGLNSPRRKRKAAGIQSLGFELTLFSSLRFCRPFVKHIGRNEVPGIMPCKLGDYRKFVL